MASLGNTIGEGVGSGHHGEKFVDTGYGTHDGQGNVEDDTVRHEKGSGFDVNTGQVKTEFGKYKIEYDDAGAAMDNTRYDKPPGVGGGEGGYGLSDNSLESTGHATVGDGGTRGEEESEEKKRKEEEKSQGR